MIPYYVAANRNNTANKINKTTFTRVANCAILANVALSRFFHFGYVRFVDCFEVRSLSRLTR